MWSTAVVISGEPILATIIKLSERPLEVLLARKKQPLT